MAKGKTSTSKKQKQKNLRDNFTKNLSTTQRTGFTYSNITFNFVFNDKTLQDQYIKTWEYFNTIFSKGRKQLPLPNKITYQDAKSLTTGKNNKKLLKLEKIKQQKDNTWMKNGIKVKNWFFDEAIKDSDGSQEITNFTDDLIYNLDRVADAMNVSDLQGKTEVKYNIVYYEDNNF
jgi:hypothetical protein